MRDLVDELLHANVRTRLFGGDHAPTLGRLVIETRLGAGAMGTVFAAFDPRLDRKVAVKVLRSAEPRVLAEARALAKLAHPNVIAIFDADELDGLAYIVMELVAGESLRAWVGTPRPWLEVVAMMREVGAGLGAAHAAGLVHRDVKPDNILIGGGRARVGDFGLVDDPGAGTPAYAAPEGSTTAASDQYSFGITFYEVLHGARPPATKRPIPAWLEAVIARAMERDPAARFASMDELVAALHPPRRGRVIAIGAVAIALGLGVTVGSIAMRGHHDACANGAARRDAIWNDAARERVHAALGKTPGPTLAALDATATRWEASYRAVCESPASAALLDARMRCLDRTLARFGALATALTHVDPAGTLAAPAAVGELPRSEDCETLSARGEVALPAEPASAVRAVIVESGLDRAWASFVLGRYRDARDQLATLGDPVIPRLHATALLLESAIESRIGDPARARKDLDDASLAAANADAPELEYDVWIRRLRNELFAGDPSKVVEWESFARAAAARAGRQGAELDGIFGEGLRVSGRLAKARDLLERALASTDPLRPEQRAVIEMNLGSVQLATGEARAAEATLQRARSRVVDAFGDHHPDLALYDDKLGAAHRLLGTLRSALRLHDRSLELRRSAFGDDDRSIATSLYQRALTLIEAGELVRAFDDLQRAIAIRTKIYGATSARLGELYAALGDAVAAAATPPAWVDGDAQALYARAAQLDPRLDLAARRTTADIAPLVPFELLSLDRAAALAIRADAATARGLRARLYPADAAALAATVGAALLAAGDRDGAVAVLTTASATLGNEPSRTALRIYIALAHADPAKAAAAARAAIATYQALPQLARPDYAELWRLAGS